MGHKSCWLLDRLRCVSWKRVSKQVLRGLLTGVVCGGALTFLLFIPDEGEIQIQVEPDTLYIGAMTLAGLAMFGSSLLARAGFIAKEMSRKDRVPRMGVVVGSFSTAFINIWFAFSAALVESSTIFLVYILVTILCMTAVALGFVWVMTTGSTVSEQG